MHNAMQPQWHTERMHIVATLCFDQGHHKPVDEQACDATTTPESGVVPGHYNSMVYGYPDVDHDVQDQWGLFIPWGYHGTTIHNNGW